MFSGVNKSAALFLGRNFNDAWLVDDACGAVSFLNDSDDPRLVTFLLFDVLAVSGCLFARQADQKSTGSFSRMALEQLEHVPASFSYCGHLGNDWQIMNHEGHFVFLMRRECLSVAQQSEACDVSGSVSVVFVHQPRRCAVKASHRVHRAVISFAHVLFRHNQLDAVPAFWLLQPLMGIDSDLSS